MILVRRLVWSTYRARSEGSEISKGAVVIVGVRENGGVVSRGAEQCACFCRLSLAVLKTTLTLTTTQAAQCHACAKYS